MPIYAYKCASCGHEQDVLQKISDPVLTDCPACGAAALQKQVTAAGFQLKGSGWYVTDFRDQGKTGKGKGKEEGKDKPDAGKEGSTESSPAAGKESAAGEAAASSTGGSPAAADKPAAAPSVPAAPAATS